MKEENRPTEAKPTIKWVRSPYGVFETYANGTTVTWSLDDVTLRFAQLGSTEETLTPGDKISSLNFQKATITIPWRMAKILHLQLGQLIANYEKVNGEINLKPTITPNEGT